MTIAQQPADRGKSPKPGILSTILATVPTTAVVLTIYVWLVSMGTWSNWPLGGSYYDQLATAFRDGQLSLQQSPTAALLALPNPYDPAARQGIFFLSDVSLYKGHYFLYFGPVPALLVAGVKSVLPVLVGDQFLAFAFTAGVFLVMMAILVRVWHRLFPALSAAVVGAALLATGLMSPFGWILGSRASVHDAAISAGQFFSLLGVYAAWIALDHDKVSKRQGLLAGLFWAAAVGSRITQILSVALMLILVYVAIASRNRDRSVSDSVRGWLPFAAPVVVGVLALGWYNWRRFGSVLETGISYQLALLYIQAHRHELFSLRYAIQNAYNYVLMPPKLRFNFPYIWPQLGIRHPVLEGLGLPSLYFAEEITGLVFTSPVLVCVFGAALGAARAGSSELQGEGLPGAGLWLRAALVASFLCGFALFLTFFWGSERYLMDFLPPGLLLAVMGAWTIFARLQAHRWRRRAAVLVVASLATVSVLVSSLLAIALNADRFRLLNPVLWRQLNNVFR